jgi:hypothetical protein
MYMSYELSGAGTLELPKWDKLSAKLKAGRLLPVHPKRQAEFRAQRKEFYFF